MILTIRKEFMSFDYKLDGFATITLLVSNNAHYDDYDQATDEER